MIYDNQYLTAAGDIKIFKPSRGVGGTLAYPIKISEKYFTFEIDDEGEWRPFPLSYEVSEAALLLIGIHLDILERKRLNQFLP